MPRSRWSSTPCPRCPDRFDMSINLLDLPAGYQHEPERRHHGGQAPEPAATTPRRAQVTYDKTPTTPPPSSRALWPVIAIISLKPAYLRPTPASRACTYPTGLLPGLLETPRCWSDLNHRPRRRPARLPDLYLDGHLRWWSAAISSMLAARRRVGRAGRRTSQPGRQHLIKADDDTPTVVNATVMTRRTDSHYATVEFDCGRRDEFLPSSVIGASDPFTVLLWASLVGLGAAIVLAVGQQALTVRQSLEAMVNGFKSMPWPLSC